MEFALGISLLLVLGLYITIQAIQTTTANQRLVEQRRREYLHTLQIAQRHPHHTAYRQLAHACGQAYVAVEDPTIFDASLLADDLHGIDTLAIPTSTHSPMHTPIENSIPSNAYQQK